MRGAPEAIKCCVKAIFSMNNRKLFRLFYLREMSADDEEKAFR